MQNQHNLTPNCHSKHKFDNLLCGSILLSASLYIGFWQYSKIVSKVKWLEILSGSVYELINIIWWGVVILILMVAALVKIPKEFVVSILGDGKGLSGKIRATITRVLLDLCLIKF